MITEILWFEQSMSDFKNNFFSVRCLLTTIVYELGVLHSMVNTSYLVTHDQVHLKYHTQLSDSTTQILSNRYLQIFMFGESAARSQDLVTISRGWIKIYFSRDRAFCFNNVSDQVVQNQCIPN